MQRRLLQVLMGIVLAAVVVSACSLLPAREDGGGVSASTYERIHEALMNMHSFSAEATIKYISNKNTNEYITLQHAKMSGEYRIEVMGPDELAGNITVFDGTTIYQFNPNVSNQIAISVNETPERSQVFLTSFIRNYIASGQSAAEVGSFEEGEATIFEATIPEEHPYMHIQRLWMCNETLNPLQMIVFDAGGVERIVITYNSFEYDPELEAGLFEPPLG